MSGIFMAEMGRRRLSMGAVRLGIFALALILFLIFAPAYRAFLVITILISTALGLAVAGLLQLWHKYRPVKEVQEVNNKRPLGLS